MVIMHTKEHIREQRNIFSAFFPLVRQCGKARKMAAIICDLRLIDSCALTGKAAVIKNIIMVLEARIGVQCRMDEGQVICLAVILHRQLPVTVEREDDR